MIYEHKDFFIACIPKTGSKSTSSWCIRNNLTPVTEYMFNKPVFATMRNNKERVLSGMAEDLYYRTLVIHNLDNDLPLPDNSPDQYLKPSHNTSAPGRSFRFACRQGQG